MKTVVSARPIALPVNVRKHMYFNRYRLEQIDQYILMTFGFASGTQILDSYASVISVTHVRESRKGIEEFLKAADIIGDFEVKDFASMPAQDGVSCCSFIQVSKNGDVAEVGLVNYSLQHFVNATVGRAGIKWLEYVRKALELPKPEQDDESAVFLADTIALLRCEPVVLKRFCVDLLGAPK